jgi:alpha-1,3-mannosyltransferase
MKILHVCHHFYPCIGGIERYVEDLCRNLVKLGHVSDVVCLNTCSYKGERLPGFQELDGIKIHRIPYLNLKIYKIAPGVLKFIKNYDIVHVHGVGFFSDFLAAAGVYHKKPLILSSLGGIFHTPSLLRLKKAYFNIVSRMVLKRFDSIIAISRKDLNLFSRISSRVICIPPGINLDEFKTIPRRPEKNTFLYVGRISKNKRLDNLIETFYHVSKEMPEARLYVVGEDWQGIQPQLKQLVTERGLEGNVSFEGAVSREELLGYFSRSEFFVSASEYEGFGISVVEAMAAGLVPIVNSIDAFKELITNEEDGFLIDFSNPKKAADEILKITAERNSKVAEKARIRAFNYSWGKTILRLEEVYRNSIQRQSKRELKIKV